MTATEFLQKTEAAAKDLHSAGELGRARNLKKTLREAKKHVRQNKKAAVEAKKSAMDFDNPTQEMKEEAKTKFGLDLDDPQIIDALNKLKANGGKFPDEEVPDNPPPDQQPK